VLSGQVPFPHGAGCRIPRNQGHTGLATGRRQWTAVARGWYGCLRHSAPNRQDAERHWPPPGFGITIRYIGRLSIGMFAVVLTTCV